jgi:hypothetical protein
MSFDASWQRGMPPSAIVDDLLAPDLPYALERRRRAVLTLLAAYRYFPNSFSFASHESSAHRAPLLQTRSPQGNEPPSLFSVFFPFFFSSFFFLSLALHALVVSVEGGGEGGVGNLSGLYEVEGVCRSTQFLPATVFGIHTRLVRLSLGIS